MNLVTLSSTTLTGPISRDANEIYLASADGLRAGQRLVVDREAMEFAGLLPGTGFVRVRRGRDGTNGAEHANGSTVWIAEGYQLYQRDPTGIPPTELLVSPWINLRTGDVWFAQGDAVGAGASTILRHWVKQVTTWTPGALGVITVAADPTAST